MKNICENTSRHRIRLHYLCSWQQDWLIDIPLPALHRWGGVINTQQARCSRRAPCFLTVMHSNPVSPLRASATFSSNKSGIKRRGLSTSQINHQLKSLRGSRVLKPVAAMSNKSRIKSRARAVGWTLGICGAAATSLNASPVLPAHSRLAQEGAVASSAQGGLFWGLGRALFNILHGGKVSGALSPADLPPSEIQLALQSSLNQTAGAITLSVDNKHFIPALRSWFASRV